MCKTDQNFFTPGLIGYLLIIAMLLIVKESSSSTISLLCLRRVDRLTSSIVDHYFSCTVKGQVVQWGIDSTSFGGYGISDVGNTVVSSQRDYDFTTTLIYARSVGNETELKSIMIISVLNTQDITLIVSCSNNIELDTASTDDNPTYEEHPNIFASNRQLALDYILSISVLPPMMLHIFVCQADSPDQTVGSNIRGVGFESGDVVGKTKSVFLTSDKTVVNTLAILTSRNASKTTSFVFITLETTFSMICSFGNTMVQLQSLPQFSLATTPPISTTKLGTHNESSTMSTISSSTSDSTEAFNGTVNDPEESEGSFVAIIVTVTIISAIIASILVAVSLILIKKFVKKRLCSNNANKQEPLDSHGVKSSKVQTLSA